MKKLSFIIIIFFAINTYVVECMFTSTSLLRSGRVFGEKLSPFTSGMQKRTFYTAESIKKFSKLPQELRIVSPVYGIAKKESGALERMYVVESNAPAIKLVQSLFHHVGNQFLPTRHISNPACALDAQMLGLVIGAAENNTLQDPLTRAYIAGQWRDAYQKIATQVKRADGTVRSVKEVCKLMQVVDSKIDILLTIIDDEYVHDKNSARSILLALCALKADLTSEHDMVNYFSAVNHVKNQCVISHEASKKNALLSKKNYTHKDYTNFKDKAGKIKPRKTMDFVAKKCELAIGAMLNAKRNISLYPPVVVRGMYGYQGQHARPSCIETAFHDLFNILLYNHETQLFDLSYLPTGLPLNKAFKSFYENYKDPHHSNLILVGQAFMDIVSGIDGVDYYQQKNYELNSNPDNFLKIANHLFGIQALSLSDLGAIVSDHRRAITFILDEVNAKGAAKISMCIKNHATGTGLQADVHFYPRHGEISVPEREKSGKETFFDPVVLVKNYAISPQAQALFTMQSGGVSFKDNDVCKNEKMPASFYYIFNTDGDGNKFFIIRGILHNKMVDEESIDYALYLYKKLDFMAAVNVVTEIIKSGTWRTFPKLKSLLIDFKDEMVSKDNSGDNEFDKVKIIQSFLANIIIDTGFKQKMDVDPEFVGYSFALYQQLSPSMNGNVIAKMMIAVLRSGLWLFNNDMKIFVTKNLDYAIDLAIRNNILDVDLAIKLYEHSGLVPQSKFLVDMLDVVQTWKTRVYNKAEVSSIAKKLIDYGADVNALSKTGKTPLYMAVGMRNADLVELLLEKGAKVDLIHKVFDYTQTQMIQERTALFLAAQKADDHIIDILLRYGANPNRECDYGNFFKSTPLGQAVMSCDAKGVNSYASAQLLLEHGADSMIPGRNNVFLLQDIVLRIKKACNPEKFVDLLIRYGVDVNRMDERGNTSLDSAYKRKLRIKSSEKIDMIIEILRQAGAQTGSELRQQENEKRKQLAIE